jgi:hypothetical protein
MPIAQVVPGAQVETFAKAELGDVHRVTIGGFRRFGRHIHTIPFFNLHKLSTNFG